MCAAVLGVGGPATAQADPDGIAGVAVSIESIVPGTFTPGRDLPLVVEVSSARAVRATVRVHNPNSFRTVQQVEVPIEVPAGGRASVILVLPAIDTDDSMGQFGGAVFFEEDGAVGVAVDDRRDLPSASLTVAAEVVAGGDTTESLRTLEFRPGAETLAVLPDLAATADVPEQVTLRGGLSTAKTVALSERVLSIGPAALAPFGTVLGTAADVGLSSPDRIGALESWVAAGGSLILEAAPDDALADVPDRLRPPPTGVSALGAGTLRRATNLSGAGLDGVIDPSSATWARQPWFDNGVFEPFDGGPETAAERLVDEADLRSGGLDGVLLAAAAYVVLVGPVLFFVLGRTNRRTAAWIIVPATAGMATIALVLVGTWQWSKATPAHTTAVLVAAAPDGTTADTGYATSLVIAPRTGGRTVEVTTTGPATPANIDLGAYTTPTLTDEGDRLTANPSLDPGTATFVAVRQQVAVPEAPTVTTARAADGTRVATVTNATSHSLSDVVLVDPVGATAIGTLAPGQSEQVPLPRMEANTREEPPDWLSSADAELVTGTLGPAVREPGTLLLTAAADDLPGPVTVDGRAVTKGRTIFLVETTVAPEGDAPTGDLALPPDRAVCPRLGVLELSGSAALPWRATVAAPPGAVDDEADSQAVIRFDLIGATPGAIPPALLVVPGALEVATVWDGDTWVDVGTGCALPPGALDTGTVLVRTRAVVPGIGADPETFADIAQFVGGGIGGWASSYREIGLVAPWAGSDS